MKYFKLVTLALFFCSITVFSQDNTIKHTIVKGETLSSIAQKYNVSISAIQKLNPNIKKTLHLNQVLLIPNPEIKNTSNLVDSTVGNRAEIQHQVTSKETLYGIAKQFKTTTKLLYEANPTLESTGLKVGQTIVIPSGLSRKELAEMSNVSQLENPTNNESQALTHQVKPKESLYVIAKDYGISLKELQEANPSIGKKGLSIGQIITLPANAKLKEKEIATTEENVAITNTSNSEVKTNQPISETEVKGNKTIETTTEVFHVVLTKETKYGIAKKYGITLAELEKQNPLIKQKLLVGSKLSIRVSPDKLEEINKEKVLGNQEQSPVVVENKIATSEDVAKETPTTIVADSAKTTVSAVSQELIDQIIQSASEKIGVRYRSGGTTSAGFDCSGLMYSTFAAFDIKLPRSSIEQSSIGEKIDDDDAQKGDLIFFRTNGRSRINHVGMVVEVNEGEIKFIHSATHSGVIISSTKEPYYQRTFAQVNRVIKPAEK